MLRSKKGDPCGLGGACAVCPMRILYICHTQFGQNKRPLYKRYKWRSERYIWRSESYKWCSAI